MTPNQKHMASVLEFFPFEHGSDAEKFVNRMANYVRYVPNTILTNHDAKQLARLFDIYVVNMGKVKTNGG